MDSRRVFRELVDALDGDGAIRGFLLISHSMESPNGDDHRFSFVFAAEGLPGKTAQVSLNATRLLGKRGLRDQSARTVSALALAVQEALEAGGHRYLADGVEDVLVVDIG